MTTLAEVAAVPVFSAGGRTYTWGDVFEAARMRGQWVEEPVPEGAAPDDAVTAAGRQFRQARRLLAGDELRAWLAERRLTLEDWNGYLRRAVLRANGATASTPPTETTLWADGICSGTFRVLAEALAARAAALATQPGGHDGADHLRAADRAYEEIIARVKASDAPRRAVETNGADWLRVDCEYLTAPDDDVAREAALLVREDGMPVPDVARQAGLEAAAGRLYTGEMTHDLRTRVMSAAPGDVLGPVGLPGGLFLVMSVRGKVAPSMDDPEIRQRAERWAVEKAVAREVAERVKWHEHG